MDTKFIGSLVVVVIVVLGGLYALSNKTETSPKQELLVEQVEEATTTSPSVQTFSVIYSDTGFASSTVTINEGQSVTWINQSSKPMWVSSAAHPSHIVYDGTSISEHCVNNAPTSDAVFDECTGAPNGTSWTFVFTKPGTWKYHNHSSARDFGTVIVSAITASSTPQ